METFGSRLKHARGSLSQASLAARLGIPQTTLSNYEKGRNEPNFAMLFQICIELDINIEWLLYGKGPMRRDERLDEAAKSAVDARVAELEKQLAEAKEDAAKAREEAYQASRQANTAYEKLLQYLRPETMRVQEPEPAPYGRQLPLNRAVQEHSASQEEVFTHDKKWMGIEKQNTIDNSAMDCFLFAVQRCCLFYGKNRSCRAGYDILRCNVCSGNIIGRQSCLRILLLAEFQGKLRQKFVA